MKFFFYLFVVFIALFIYGIFLSQYELAIIPNELVRNNPEGFHDYKGVINIHSSFSTGSGSITEIIAAAQEDGLNFISLTDLNIFEKPREFQGYHNDLLVLIDGEYSYLNSRLLNFDASTEEHLKGVGQSQALFAELLSQKKHPEEYGFFILAHPFKPRYQWTGEYPVGLDGIEIINLKSMWQQAWLKSKVIFLWSVLIYPFNSRLALLRLFDEPEAELALWDQLAEKHRTLGIAGTDAEAKINLFGTSVSYPSYKTLFGIVRNHVLLRSELTGHPQNDRKKLVQALREGQFYISLDSLADPKGFNAYVEDSQKQIWPMGDEIVFQKGLELNVQLPYKPIVPFDIIVYRNGEPIHTSNSISTNLKLTQAGVYRVKVRVIPTFPIPDGKKWVPWIYTNPFYIR